MCFTKALPSATQPPVWERAYAVSKTKKCVEGAAETRGADETITEGLFVTLPVNSNGYFNQYFFNFHIDNFL